MKERNKSENVVAVIRDFEDVIKDKNKKTIWLTYQQGKIFQGFKKKEKFIKMITNFYVSRSIISFKNSTSKLVDKYPTVKN